MTITATLVIVLLTALVSWRAFGDRALHDRLILWPPAIERRKQYDRLLTHGFIHADWMHLIFNMVTLYSFGGAVERVFVQWIGVPGFVLFYLSAIVVAILPTYLRHRHDSRYASLGASGGVSAVLFSFILFAPRESIYLFLIPVGIPAIVFAVLYVAYSIWMDRQGTGKTNHSAHLWGAAYGILFTVLLEPEVLGHFTRTLMGDG